MRRGFSYPDRFRISEHWGEMKRIVVATACIALVGAIAVPAHSAPTFTKKFASCADVLAKYPNGIAKNKSAANTAAKDGFARPKVSAAIYKANSARLDRDKKGVLCEREMPKAITFKTDFGFITAQPVQAPKPGQCVSVPVTIDVRNLAAIGSFGLTVRLVSEFGSVYGYEEVSTSPDIVYPYMITGPGVYEVPLKACGDSHTWTHVSGNRTQAVAGVRTDERVSLAFSRWLGNRPLGAANYVFIK
jgi:hypothetical protein